MNEEEADLILREMEEKEQFLERVARGVPPMLAGHELRWHPKQVSALMADPEFMELVDAAIERSIDTIESVLHDKAKNGNMSAIMMVLYNRRPERWRDVKRIEVSQQTQVTVTHVEATKAAAVELLRANGAAVMQQLTPGPQTDIVDAEVVTDDDA